MRFYEILWKDVCEQWEGLNWLGRIALSPWLLLITLITFFFFLFTYTKK